MKLQAIKRLLRVGFHPTEFGAQLIGDGAQRRAYLIGNYVIKRRCPAWQHDRRKDADGDRLNDCAKRCAARIIFAVPTAAFRKAGIASPKQYTVREWIIQLYFRPLTKIEAVQWEWLQDANVRWQNITLDLYQNIGVNLVTGAVTAFDW